MIWVPVLVLTKLSQQENLYLVMQKGRLFQQEHPEIPVLLDKGRFLVVDLEPELANKFNQREDPCYRIQPLGETQVAFTVRPKLAARRTSVEWIQDLVEKVSRSSLEANLTQLVSWSTRYSTSPSYSEAATWAQEQLSAMGYQTRLENIAVGSSTSHNVIADKSGNHEGNKDLVIVVAHLDSINASIPAVLTIEGTDSANSNIHTANDIEAHINYDLMQEILRMNVAFIANAVGQ